MKRITYVRRPPRTDHCYQCGRPLPEDRTARRVYCSDRCSRLQSTTLLRLRVTV